MNLSKLNFVMTIISLMIIVSSFSNSYGEEDRKTKWGFSFSVGPNADLFHDQPDLTIIAFLPRVDLALHKNWDLEFEGNFSYYAISGEKNLYLLGCNSNILFKPLQWRRGLLFILGGVGLGYTNSNGMVEEIGDSHVAGVLQGGTGIYLSLEKDWWLRWEYRYQHISDPFNRDSGLNTHNFILGLSF